MKWTKNTQTKWPKEPQFSSPTMWTNATVSIFMLKIDCFWIFWIVLEWLIHWWHCKVKRVLKCFFSTFYGIVWIICHASFTLPKLIPRSNWWDLIGQYLDYGHRCMNIILLSQMPLYRWQIPGEYAAKPQSTVWIMAFQWWFPNKWGKWKRKCNFVFHFFPTS